MDIQQDASIEEVNNNLNRHDIACGKNYYGGYSLITFSDKCPVENGYIKGIHHTIESFESFQELKTWINEVLISIH